MKKPKVEADDMRAEYDFSTLPGVVRGKYFRRFQKGSNVAVLEPEVLAAFPSSDAVNAALRAVLTASKAIRSRPAVRKRSSLATRRSK